ncbi:MAG TPA: hypothetical protein PK859_08810 [Spirochaetota bacterium]|nr:hypothetical protein [Spirochaetota bacterium]HPR49513.1 hypothetical protein [Spirochaetota bacterium]
MESILTTIGRILIESETGEEALERIKNEIRGDSPLVDVSLIQLGIVLTEKFHEQLIHGLKHGDPVHGCGTASIQ